MPALSRRDCWVLGSVLVLALALRLFLVLFMPSLSIRSDASGYDASARRLIATGSYAYPVGGILWADDVFREDAWPRFVQMPPNAFAMPGYAWFIAGIYRVVGTGPDRFTAVRVMQALIATLTLLLIFAVGDSLLGRRVAWIALALNTLYPPNIWVAQFVLTETLFTFLLVGQVALMVRAAGSRRLVAYAGLGLMTAAAAYVRPIAVLAPVLLLVLEVVRHRRRPPPRPSWRPLGLRFLALGLVVALLLAPWVARNGRIYGIVMPTTSAAALPPLQGETIVRGLPFPAETIPQLADIEAYGNDDHRFAEAVSARLRASMPPASPAAMVSAQLGKAKMLGEALTSPFTFFSTPVPVMSPEFVVQVVILLGALIGLWRHRRRPEVVALVGAIPAYFVVVHWLIAMMWSRYLYPTMPFLLLLAAAAMVAPAEKPRARSRRAAKHG